MVGPTLLKQENVHGGTIETEKKNGGTTIETGKNSINKNYFTINSKDKPLPKVLSSYYWDFEHARSKPTLFRLYQKRFYKLIQDLKANIETTGSTYDTLFKGKENDSDHPANYQRSIYSDTDPAPKPKLKPKPKKSFFGNLVRGFLGR